MVPLPPNEYPRVARSSTSFRLYRLHFIFPVRHRTQVHRSRGARFLFILSGGGPTDRLVSLVIPPVEARVRNAPGKSMSFSSFF